MVNLRNKGGHPHKSASPPPELSVGPAPASDDPQAQAEYFLEMIDALAQQGTPDAKRIRKALLDAIAEYDSAEDKIAAREVLKARVVGMEVGVSRLLLGSTRKIRDRLMKESRRLGTSSPAGQLVRDSAEAFRLMSDALNKMMKAAEKQDQELREEANRLLAIAQSKMAAVHEDAGGL